MKADPSLTELAHQGNLPTGDIDLWTFDANTGDSIVLKMGSITEVGAFSPGFDFAVQAGLCSIRNGLPQQ